MKKIILTFSVCILSMQSINACAWYDPDYEYFNLFTQSIIADKSLTPFLLSYSNPFYEEEGVEVPDDNIQAWKKYFNNQLTFNETKSLVYDISLEDLNNLKNKRSLNNPILKKVGFGFYDQYKEAVDYLIEAKFLQPYMRIQHVENPDSFYYYYDEETKDASDLDYNKIYADLISLYNATNSKEIKLRYGYQIVRFNHYNRNYQKAIDAFNQYVEPLNLKTTPYYMALDQMAGAQRGLGLYEEANWNFFRVFRHSLSRKASAYSSMRLNNKTSFEDLLNRASNNEEKVWVHFLLAYQDFNSPLPKMHEIYDLDPSAEVLKVLEARAINELERLILSDINYTADDLPLNTVKPSAAQTITESQEKAKEKKTSFWGKIVNFFKDLFNINNEEQDHDEVTPKTDNQEDKKLLQDPRRLPIIRDNTITYTLAGDQKEVQIKKYIAELEDFTQQAKEKDSDIFWDISYAYLQFLQKDYAESQRILNGLFTNNAAYNKQIQKMKMLNEIVSQPKIDAKYEERIMEKYPNFFLEDEKESEDDYSYEPPSTREFLQDVLANRYYMQGELAKSYLMSNSLTNLTSNPDYELAKLLEDFYNKPNKSTFEKQILVKHLDVEDPASFFNLIYGDYYTRNGNFQKAYESYKNVINGNGFIPITYTEWDSNTMDYITKEYPKDAYNYFNNIPDLIFGHNYWVSYESDDEITMVEEPFIDEFKTKPYAHDYHPIKDKMNKAELMLIVLNLQKVAQGKDERAAKANQLIGNLLYNTSKLGYYRHVFVFDINNHNGSKYHFYSEKTEENQENLLFYKYYYLDSDITSNNFTEAQKYYEKALKQSNNKEQKARILFQLASIEQANYYQWKTEQPAIPYSDDDWYEKKQAQEKRNWEIKEERFNNYFKELKQGYADTQTARDLMQSCNNFKYFMLN